MDDILNVVFESCIPAEWVGVDSSAVVRSDYENHRYRLFEVSTGSTEYLREVEAFREGDLIDKVTQLQRVQNPIQLGKFLIRKEQKKHRGNLVEEVKYYHPIKNESELTIALEYNMDVRRYNNASPGQVSEKNPQFYRTPRAAFDVYPFTYQYIIVCNVLSEMTYEYGPITRKNDSDYMPVYVAKMI